MRFPVDRQSREVVSSYFSDDCFVTGHFHIFSALEERGPDEGIEPVQTEGCKRDDLDNVILSPQVNLFMQQDIAHFMFVENGGQIDPGTHQPDDKWGGNSFCNIDIIPLPGGGSEFPFQPYQRQETVECHDQDPGKPYIGCDLKQTCTVYCSGAGSGSRVLIHGACRAIRGSTRLRSESIILQKRFRNILYSSLFRERSLQCVQRGKKRGKGYGAQQPE